MVDPSATALSELNVGDVFEFAQLSTGTLVAAEYTPQWKVTSTGKTHFGVALKTSHGSGDVEKFSSTPMLFPSKTSVLKVRLISK